MIKDVHYSDYSSQPNVHYLCGTWTTPAWPNEKKEVLPEGVYQDEEDDHYTFEHKHLVTCTHCFGALFNIVPCRGNIYVCDQTLACDDCGEDLWNYPGIDELKISIDQYWARFFARHPFVFCNAHDHGDEDSSTWNLYVPVGGFTASFNRYHYGNAIEKYVR